jgi:hypothetical protein
MESIFKEQLPGNLPRITDTYYINNLAKKYIPEVEKQLIEFYIDIINYNENHPGRIKIHSELNIINKLYKRLVKTYTNPDPEEEEKEKEEEEAERQKKRWMEKLRLLQEI